MLPSFYVMLALMLLYELADLNETSEKTKTLLSAVQLKGIQHQDQMLKMMQYNPVQITCAGVVFNYQKVNTVAVGVATLLGTALIQYYFPNLTN